MVGRGGWGTQPEQCIVNVALQYSLTKKNGYTYFNCTKVNITTECKHLPKLYEWNTLKFTIYVEWEDFIVGRLHLYNLGRCLHSVVIFTFVQLKYV